MIADLESAESIFARLIVIGNNVAITASLADLRSHRQRADNAHRGGYATWRLEQVSTAEDLDIITATQRAAYDSSHLVFGELELLTDAVLHGKVTSLL